MRVVTTPESRLELSRALGLIAEALDILDEIGAPGEIGGTLDLAASRLQDHIDREDSVATGVEALIAQLQGELNDVRLSDGRARSPWALPR